MYIYISIYIYIHIHIHTHTHTHTHIHIYIHIFTYTYIHIYICIYTHIYMYKKKVNHILQFCSTWPVAAEQSSVWRIRMRLTDLSVIDFCFCFSILLNLSCCGWAELCFTNSDVIDWFICDWLFFFYFAQRELLRMGRDIFDEFGWNTKQNQSITLSKFVECQLLRMGKVTFDELYVIKERFMEIDLDASGLVRFMFFSSSLFWLQNVANPLSI